MQTFNLLLCLLATLVAFSSADISVYESDFDTGIPGVYGHSVVVTDDGYGSEADSTYTTSLDAAELLDWAQRQLDLMAALPKNRCTRPVLLVDLLPEDGGNMDQEYYGSGQYDQYIVEEYTADAVYDGPYATYRTTFFCVLMGVLAITVIALIKQAREYRKAVEEVEEESFSFAVTNKTPLLSTLPYEGAQEVPVIVVSQESPVYK